MRVISGKSRGTKLEAPEGMNTRPTTDRIKETLFNMIAFDLPGAAFLDLFSGSGAIGIESLSRGAKEVVFVENNPQAIQCIHNNLKKTGLQDSAIVYNIDIYNALKKLKDQNKKFDIIFLDPPYLLEGISDVLTNIVQNELLVEGGYIILESSSKLKEIDVEGLEITKLKQYKTTNIHFMKGIDQ